MLKRIAFCFIGTFLLMGCGAKTSDVKIPDNTAVKSIDSLPLESDDVDRYASDKQWSTYLNEEYGFTFNYPNELDGGKLNVVQQGNKFSISVVRPNGIESELPITVALNIESVTDLVSYIKENYGKTCELAGIEKDKAQDGHYLVSIQMNELPERCWINWVLVLKYYPETGKLVALDLGQESPVLEMVNGVYLDYSHKIADSFRFN